MSDNIPELWSLAQIKEHLAEEANGATYFIQIPKFQRSYVWKESQIKKLVDSIYKGFPIGSLLAFKTDESRDGKVVIQLVDGLQRVTSISRFLSAPMKYAPIEELLEEDYLAKISSILFGSDDPESKLQATSRIRQWFASVESLEYGEHYNARLLAQSLAGEDEEAFRNLSAFFFGSEAADRLLGRVLQNLREVREYKVPVNLYTGPIENVPTIFERINSQGASLSKYEILAASWSLTEVAVTNQDVLEAIAAKYRVLINQGYEVEGFDDSGDMENAEYNLYEYLFGLGKVLAKNFPTLFHSSDSDDENSPVAFQIFTVALQLPVAKMGQLAAEMPRGLDGKIDVSRLEAAVLEACKKVESALAQHLSLRLNEQNLGPSGISQNQAISYVTSFLANCYGEDFSTFDRDKAKKLEKNIPAHFLIDILRGSWSGSGDSTLFERTWNLSDSPQAEQGKKKYSPSAHYLQGINGSALKNSFNLWHAEQLEAKQTQRVRYPKDFKPVLKFIYSSLVSSLEDKGVEFELEHVYPVKVLKQIIVEEGLDGLPMAAVGNLMLLPKETNRNKQAKALGDFALTDPHSEFSKLELERLERLLIAPSLEEITFTRPVSLDTFKDFCSLRAEAMANHLVEVLHLDS